MKKAAKDARDAALRADRARNNDSETPEAEDSILGFGDADKTTAGKTEAGGKKRKAEDEGLGGKKKKKKDGAGGGDAGKAKLPRPKAPVDVEKQCGVELPNGGQCARSLTCKSHSMGAKRAVPGRSAPYDKLLADYQRKNQAKLQSEFAEPISSLYVTLLIWGDYRSGTRRYGADPRRRPHTPRPTHRFRRGKRSCHGRHPPFSAYALVLLCSSAAEIEVSDGEDEGDVGERAGRERGWGIIQDGAAGGRSGDGIGGLWDRISCRWGGWCWEW